MYFHPTTQAYVRDGEPFTHDSIQYPAAWDKLSLGFVEVTTVGTPENDKYFYVSETLEGSVRTIINTPKPAEQIAAMRKGEVDAKLALVRSTREGILNRLTGIALAAQLAGDTATVASFVEARAALLDITTGCPTDPALVDAFIFTKFLTIRAAVPLAMTKAFAGVDA